MLMCADSRITGTTVDALATSWTIRSAAQD